MLQINDKEVIEHVQDLETIEGFIEKVKTSEQNVFTFLGYRVRKTRTVRCVSNYPSCNKCTREVRSLALTHRDEDQYIHGTFLSDDDVLFTKDHIIPQQRGGTNHWFNLQTLCYNCNTEKGGAISDDVNPVTMITASAMKNYCSYQSQHEWKDEIVDEIKRRTKEGHPCPSVFRREKFLNMFDIKDSSIKTARERGVIEYSFIPRSAIEDWL